MVHSCRADDTACPQIHLQEEPHFMNKNLFRRTVSFAAALAVTASLGITARAAENDGLCPHHPSHTEDCGYEATGACTHECTIDSGCITTRCSHEHVATCYNGAGKLNCHHKCDKTPECSNPIVVCVHTQHGDCGHSDGEDCSFAVNGCILCNAVELKGTDVVLNDGTEYTYTGNLITPAVTVTVDGTVLVENQDYVVTYANNIAVGTGTVIVTGTETSGYTGTVEIPFTISKAPGTPEFTLVEIKGTDVTIDGTEFAYTGQAIEPAVTVTAGGKVLTAGTDYSITYANNTEPGTASVTVKGIATASETVGYTGEVTIEFTIVKAQEPETPSEPSEPENPSEPSEPDTDDKEETKPFDYKITKGSGAKWAQKSDKALSFTLNADTDGITAVTIDGKKLDKTHYTLGDDGVVTLKNSYLNKLAIGTYRIGFTFDDGDVSGTFTVTAAKDPTNPSTGDSIGIWFGLMAASMAAVAGLAAIRRRKA